MDHYDQWCVAIVDDDEALADLISDGLEAEGYQTGAFASAATFLQYTRQHGLPHLALIDLGVPNMDGFRLSSRLKALGDVPIIFISGHKETETVVKGLQLRSRHKARQLGACHALLPGIRPPSPNPFSRAARREGERAGRSSPFPPRGGRAGDGG